MLADYCTLHWAFSRCVRVLAPRIIHVPELKKQVRSLTPPSLSICTLNSHTHTHTHTAFPVYRSLEPEEVVPFSEL